MLDFVETDSGTSAYSYLNDTRRVAATDDLDVSTAESAGRLLGILDDALSEVSSRRAALGALSSRFESAQSVLSTSSENVISARSQLIDADFAFETADLTKAQILQQASIAVLGQANQSLQAVLQLLR